MNGERPSYPSHPSREKLQRHYDGDLSESEAEDLREHLRTCAQCEAELHSLERLSDMLRWSTDDATAAAELDFTQMFAQIEHAVTQPEPTNVVPFNHSGKTSQPSGRARFFYRAAPALGAVALAAAALLMVNRQDPLPDPVSAGQELALLDTSNHAEVVAVKFGKNAGQVFGIALADGESVPVVWIDDDDDDEEE